MTWTTVVFFFIGLAFVLLGSDFLVDGASGIARRSGISEFVIGLTIVGIGTSTPEMVVSFISAIEGNADIAVGNVVGSNIFNTFLILGATSIILPMSVSKECIRRDIPLNVGVSLLLVFLGMNKSVFGAGENVISRVDGIVMLLLFAAYMYVSFKKGAKDSLPATGLAENGNAPVDADTADKSAKSGKSTAFYVLAVIFGLGALIYGGELFVDNAVKIAGHLGWSDKFIAITILAGGTSLPELATCIVAAVKKKGQLALGNVLGSNISNVLLILGGAAVIHPLSMENVTSTDLGFLVLASLFLPAACLTFNKFKIDRAEGAFMLIAEAVYMYLLIIAL